MPLPSAMAQQPNRLARMAAVAMPMPASSIGLDGIRRTAMPSPQEVLQNMQAAVMAPAVATPTTDEVAAEPRSWRRPTIAFGLVAGALVVSAALATGISQLKAQTASADNTKTTNPAASTAPSLAPTPAAAAPAVVAQQNQEAALQQLLTAFAASHGNHYNIVVKDLKTGATAGVNPTTSMESASLYKLFVADRIYNLIDTGKLSYGGSAGGGSGRNVQGCLTVMINISDNTCGHALGDIVGWGNQNTALANLGFTGTNLAGTYPQTSPHDVALLLERVYNGTLNSPNSNTDFLNLLKDQRVNNRLPQGLPAGTIIAHKTGDLDGYMHDAGIVYGPKTDYIVAVMGAPGANPADFATLSQQLWNYFAQ